MPNLEEIAREQDKLTTYRRRLRYQLDQQIRMGVTAQYSLIEDIRLAREEIQGIKARLRSWDVQVDDHTDDEESPARARARQQVHAALQGATSIPLSERKWYPALVNLDYKDQERAFVARVIAQLIPMFEMSRRGLDNAIDVLRGRPPRIQGQAI